MTAYFAPTDLREVDPRPAELILDTEEAIVRELLASRLHGDELNRALQALGLEPYERMLNTAGRDAWVRNSTIGTRTDGVNCLNGHERAVYSTRDSKGAWYCRECNRISVARRAQAKREAA
jgi:hypothetical protein